MAWITFPRDMKAKAKAAGRSMLACGYEGKAGRNEFCGPCDDDVAQSVFVLAIKMHTGSTLDEAVASLKEAIADRDKRRAEKAASDDGEPS